jgi:hypothetical protein
MYRVCWLGPPFTGDLTWWYMHACFLAFPIQNLKLLTSLISFFLCTVVLCFFISGIWTTDGICMCVCVCMCWENSSNTLWNMVNYLIIIITIIGPVRRAVPNLIQPLCLVRGQDGRFGPSRKPARTKRCPALRVIKVQQIAKEKEKGNQSRRPTSRQVYQSWSLQIPHSLVVHNTSPRWA